MQQGIHIHTPKMTKFNKIIIGVIAVSFLLQFFLGKIVGISWVSLFGLIPLKVYDGHIYQMLTYPLAHQGFIGVLFDCLIIWFIGCDLEEIWGQKTYALFIGSSLIGSSVLYMIIGTFFSQGIPMVGVSGLCYSLLMGYAIMYPDRLLSFMLIFPVKAKYFCPLIILVLVFMGMSSPYGQASLGHLGAMLSGFLFLRLEATYKISQKFKAPKKSIKAKKRKSHLKLIHGERDGKDKDPKYWQ